MSIETVEHDILLSSLLASDGLDYFGTLAIHFVVGDPLLLPVSGEEAAAALEQFRTRPIVLIRALDNRIVAARSAAITDLYVSSEDFDTRGPENNYERIGAIDFAPEFWEVMHLAYLGTEDLLVEQFSAERIQGARTLLAHLKMLFSDESDCDKLVQANAQNVTWRYSGGATRIEDLSSRMEYDDVDVYDDIVFWFTMLGQKTKRFDSKLVWDKHPGHRTIGINLDAIDYISAPLHLVSAYT